MYKLSETQLRDFPEFRNNTFSMSVTPVSDTFFDTKKDPIMDSIFAPNPITGFPSPDLALAYSKDTRPEISQYLQEVLMKPIPSSVGSDSADLALESVKSRYESMENYANRLREIVQRSLPKKNENSK